MGGFFMSNLLFLFSLNKYYLYAMDNFGLVTAIKEAAELKGWGFYLGIDKYCDNINLQNEQAMGEISLVLKPISAVPKWSGLTTAEITYSNKIMIGRKFDDDGQAANMDETYQQKFDRRLTELTSLLDEFLKTLICDNDLILGTHSGYVDGINLFDQNIDFVTINSLTLIQ